MEEFFRASPWERDPNITLFELYKTLDSFKLRASFLVHTKDEWKEHPLDDLVFLSLANTSTFMSKDKIDYGLEIPVTVVTTEHIGDTTVKHLQDRFDENNQFVITKLNNLTLGIFLPTGSEGILTMGFTSSSKRKG